MTINFGTEGPIPTDLPARSELHYWFSASSPADGDGFAAISAIFREAGWIIEVREDDEYRVLERRPEIARRVLTMQVDARDLPKLMEARFRWHASSQWMPKPTETASEIFSDYCPDQGFPHFRGMSN